MRTKLELSFMQQDSRKHSLRLFCAVELPEAVLIRAAEFIARMRQSSTAAGVRWEQIEKLHITLKFFGEVDARRLDQLSESIVRAARGVSPFMATIEGTGAFPGGRKPRVLWLGIGDASGRLAELHRRLEDECAHHGFAPEPREFHPHLTIARLRFPEAARELIARHKETEFAAVTFPVSEVVLMQSELGPGGSRYSVLSRHSLGSGDAPGL